MVNAVKIISAKFLLPVNLGSIGVLIQAFLPACALLVIHYFVLTRNPFQVFVKIKQLLNVERSYLVQIIRRSVRIQLLDYAEIC